jgi:PAS domain S-box-containing protein
MHLLPLWLNLDACSTIRLATLVLALATAAYLLSRRGKSRATLFLGLVFCGAAIIYLSSILEFAGRYYWQPRNLKNLLVPLLQDVGPSAALLSLLLFTYHFPQLPGRQRREFRVVLSLASLVAAGMLALTVYNFVFLERGASRFDFTMTYYTLLYGTVGGQILLVVFLLLRRSVSLSGGKSRPWWARLRRPVGRHAATARALAFAMLLPVGSVLGYVLLTYGLLPLPVATYLVWLAFLLFHFVFLVTYLNRAAERSTFQVKLTGLTLIPVFALLGLIAVLDGKFTEADYSSRELVPNRQSFRFTPNARGSYDIEETSLSLDTELGERLDVPHEGSRTVSLPFDFPFFRRPYRSIRVLHGPMIYLGRRLEENGWGGYAPNPAIAPVIMNLDPGRGGGIFLNSRSQSVTVTWYELPELSFANANTIQLALHADGSFTMCFARVHSEGRYSSVQMYNYTTATTTGRHPGSRGQAVAFGPRLTGIHPGEAGAPLKPLRFSEGLPYSSPGPEVIFDSYEAAYAAYLHGRMALLAVILLASSVLILFVFPFLFQANLIRPLRALAEGMRRADAGDLDVNVRPLYRDEIGFLTRCFNRMVQSIRQHETSFRMVAENLQEGILIVRDGTPVYANRRLSEITGYSREELTAVGLPGLIRGETQPVEGEAEGQPEAQPEELLLATKAGTGVPVELSRTSTVWHGRPAEVIVVRDISRRKGNEERARQRDQRLMQTNKLTTLGVLLASMAHQLTTPSHAILQATSVLGRACPALASILEGLGSQSEGLLIAGLEIPQFRKVLPEIAAEIERNARRIEDLIVELQGFGREDPFPVMGPVDLNGVLRSAVELASGHLKRATERFALELEPELPPVHGNPWLLEQVVVNLLLNACQALADRSQAIALRCRADREARQVRIEVQDEGAGIPAEILGRLGEWFFTTRRAAGGTGLGLHVARSIAARHGGTLEITSVVGRGTTVVVTLPAAGEA